MRAVVAVTVMLVSGCASLGAPEREIRVTEYGAGAGSGLAADGSVAGCRVVQTGDAPDVLIAYHGERCHVATPMLMPMMPAPMAPPAPERSAAF